MKEHVVLVVALLVRWTGGLSFTKSSCTSFEPTGPGDRIDMDVMRVEFHPPTFQPGQPFLLTISSTEDVFENAFLRTVCESCTDKFDRIGQFVRSDTRVNFYDCGGHNAVKMANAQLDYKFLPTHRGRYLCVNGYMFVVNKRKREECISWKCAKKDCRSTVSTTNDIITKMPGDHNHDSVYNEIKSAVNTNSYTNKDLFTVKWVPDPDMTERFHFTGSMVVNATHWSTGYKSETFFPPESAGSTSVFLCGSIMSLLLPFLKQLLETF